MLEVGLVCRLADPDPDRLLLADRLTNIDVDIMLELKLYTRSKSFL